MMTGFKHLHSYFAYLVLLSIVVAIVYFIVKGKKQLTSNDKKFALIPMVFTHLQFVFGIVLYFMQNRLHFFSDMSNMKISSARLLALEHPIINIIAITLITIGYGKIKRKIAAGQNNGIEWAFFLVGLILILSRIPFNTWLG